MTYSIVARDAATGAIGVAVQSHHFAVGSTVPHVQAGVGAVVRQSFAAHSYGPQGLALLRTGARPGHVLRALTGADERRGGAQLAVLAADGTIEAYTGRRCVPFAGHVVADGVAALANMAAGPIWEPMLDAFTRAEGGLVARLLCALEAADAAGGDVRGRQSAGVLVVGSTGDAPVIDLRVDDHPDPLAELRRLHGLRIATDLVRRAAELAPTDLDAAVHACATAQHRFGATNLEPTVWQAALLASHASAAAGRDVLLPVLEVAPHWAAFVRALGEVGLVPDADALLATDRAAV